MDELLARAAMWMFAALMAFAAMAVSANTAFSIHVGICIAALLAMAASMNKFDFLTQQFPVLSGPSVASRYDNDPIRWGVIATMFGASQGYWLV